jgi:colicin import membrane protein
VADEGSKTKAWIGAILVHVALVAVLVFSVRWKQEAPSTVAVDLVMLAPRSTPPVAALPPAPEPPPPEKAPPPPAPKPTPVPPAEAKNQQADIAKKREVEKQQKEREAQKAKEQQALKLAQEQAAKKETEKKLADARTKELAAAKERAVKEQRDEVAKQELAEKAAKEQRDRAAAQEAAERAAREAAQRARAKAEGDWVAKIRGKIRGNIVLAADVPGNPQATFEVSLLPTGEVLNVRLTRSSGSAAYDQAVERAILKSSPLPKPDQQEVFQRQLTLNFRPLE